MEGKNRAKEKGKKVGKRKKKEKDNNKGLGDTQIGSAFSNMKLSQWIVY